MIKISAIQIGAKYLITITNRFLSLNLPVNSTSSIIDFGFITYPIKIHVRNAAIGIITLFEMKSKNVRKSIPITFMLLHAPLPSDEGTPRRSDTKSTSTQDLFLVSLNLSQNKDTTVSISEIDDVSAAKRTRRKKSAPINAPPFMLSKTLGS